MKKITFLTTAILLTVVLFTSCKKKEPNPSTETKQAHAVEKKNTGLVFKFTGTNCYYCGDWGWDMFKTLINQYHKKDAVCIGAYSQNSFAKLLISPIATDMDKRVPVTKGYPTFTGIFNDAWGGGNTFESMNNIISTSITNHKNSPVVANVGFTQKIEGDKMVVSTTTKFFQSTDGEYYLGVYILEDGIVANQAGPKGGPNAVHDNVLRGGNGSWGELISSGSVADGKYFDKVININLASEWNKAKLTVYSVIWKKNGDKYDFVNASINP
jgi:hypothetical protein